MWVRASILLRIVLLTVPGLLFAAPTAFAQASQEEQTYTCGALTLSFMLIAGKGETPAAPQGAPVLAARVQQRKTVIHTFDVDQEPHLRVSCRDVTHDGVPELQVVTFSLGAHCCFTHYIFTSVGQLRLLARIETNDGGPLQFIQLNGRGPLEAIAFIPFLAYSYASFAQTASLPYVFTLVKGRYVDTSRCFPGVLQHFAARHPEHTTPAVVTRMAAAMVRGDGQALQRLLASAPAESRRTIIKLMPALKRELRSYGLSSWLVGAVRGQPVLGRSCKQLR